MSANCLTILWLPGKTLQSLHFFRRKKTLLLTKMVVIREGLHFDCDLENEIYFIRCKKMLKTMYEVLLLGFGHVLIIAAVAAESFVRDILSSGFFSYSFYVIWILWYWPLGMILIDKGLHKQETRKREFFGNISLSHLYRMDPMSE